MRPIPGAAGFALAAVALSAAPAAAQPAPYFPPRGEWARRAPAQVGLNPALVDSAIAFAKASESGTTRDLEAAHWQSAFGREPLPEPLGPFKPRGDMTGIIVRNGYIVAEWGEPDRVDLTFSVTKSFLSSTAGLAWDRKLIPDLHAKVKELVTTGEFDSSHNSKITWDHLLRQTSDWEGTLWSKPDWSDRPPANTPIEEYKKRVRNEPGTSYKYNDVRVNALAYALLRVWKRPLAEVLREFVMDPIGASDTWVWHGYRNSTVELDGRPMVSVGGGAHWGGGMWITARDQARFGLLTLHRGSWGERRILSEEWIAQALTPTAPQPTYGFMNYFLNTGQRQWPSAPASTFCHLGNGTNAVCVLPDYDMVVVLRWIRGNAVDGVLKRLIEAAGSPSAPPQQPAAGPVTRTDLLKQVLPPGDFRNVQAAVIELAPGAQAPRHRHDVAVMAYVLEGTVENRFDGGSPQTHKAGESWWEAPGTVHDLARNASSAVRARLLVVYIGEEGKAPTVPLQAPGPAVREGYVEAGGVRLFYRAVGTGRDTLVVLHGGPGFTLDYLADDLLPLAERHTLIFHDQRGTGRSSLVRDSAALDGQRFAEDLEAVRRHFRLERVALLGHSWGAGVAALYAGRYPERIGRLIIVGGIPLRRSLLTSAFDALAAGRDSGTRRQMQQWREARLANPGDPAACRAYYVLWFTPFFVDSAAARRSKGDFCAGSPESLRNKVQSVDRFTMASLGEWDWRASVRSLKAPVLVIHGSRDVLPLDGARGWATVPPDARLLLLEDTGHFPWLEAPDRFFAAIHDFLQGRWPAEARRK